MEKLKISENRRYFTHQDGTPFIWLADTVWTLAQRLKWDDVEYLMQKRKSQGFTVLQLVALDPEQDKEMRNPAGDKALLNNNLNTPNEKYFEYLDWIVDKAEEYGFYVLLLPVWGELVVGHNWMGEFSEKIVTKDNAYEYGKWIGNRYKDRTNIIWGLGGDRQPIHLGVDYKDVWRSMAEGIAKGVLGKDLKHNDKDPNWEKLLMTYHPCHEQETGECSTMSYWTDDDVWISFIMIQSGHGLTPKNYDLVKTYYDTEQPMPVFDAEPAYEQMPTAFPVPGTQFEYHGGWMVRKRAYWSLFAGSFGHTYGHASVWCMISEKERDSWR
ncbi:apiosidase-like domain-containing protein, partial [Bacillus solitudinis]|uniref:apiosidase-like domain-containing protein n=1 Tax=Bacillus solitudinis TaxID=2014074 RepID=UPI000C231167